MVKLKILENNICLFVLKSGKLAVGMINCVSNNAWELLELVQISPASMERIQNMQELII